MLLVSVSAVLAALGAAAFELQASALRTVVAAVVGLLGPLFWPGNASTAARTTWRVVYWSLAAACLAAIAMRAFGSQAQTWPRILTTCGMLMPILLLTHALAAALEARLRCPARGAEASREIAGRTASILLALVGSMPLWLGPAGELLSSRHAGFIDAVVGVSPLTHLAVASNNDLLRNQWLYQHSNLSGLPVTYPQLAPLVWTYATACLAMLAAAAFLRWRRVAASRTRTDSTMEKTP